MKLNKKEEAWLKRFQKTMDAAPKSLGEKICSYTIGDRNITLYDEKAKEAYEKENITWQNQPDECTIVDQSGAWTMVVDFPFNVDSTAG